MTDTPAVAPSDTDPGCAICRGIERHPASDEAKQLILQLYETAYEYGFYREKAHEKYVSFRTHHDAQTALLNFVAQLESLAAQAQRVDVTQGALRAARRERDALRVARDTAVASEIGCWRRIADEALRLLSEVTSSHRDKESCDYNACEKPDEACAFCEQVAEIVSRRASLADRYELVARTALGQRRVITRGDAARAAHPETR